MKKTVVKRVISVGLAGLLVAGCVACGSNSMGTGSEAETEVSTDTAQDTYVDKLDRTDEGYVLVWNDEFDGEALDTTKWSCQIGTGTSEGLTGWGNQELEYYTDREENVRVEDGKLVITAIKEEERYGGQLFTSARLRTYTDDDKTLFATKYGRIEARIKLPEGEGLWPAFWMLPVDDSLYNEWASSGEIDIMEARGRLPDRIEGTIHYGQNWPNNIYKGQEYIFPEGTDITDYHLYSLEWEPGKLSWYIDNECYHTTDKWFSQGPASATDYTYPAPFDVPFYILLNMAVGGTFDLESDPYSTEYPAQMFVDFVRVYQKEAGYETVAKEETVAAADKDTEAFEQYAAAYTDGEFIADKEFTTMNIEPIEDTTNGVIPDKKDWQFAVGNFGGFAKAEIEELDEGKFAKIDISSGGSQTYAVQLIQHLPAIEGYTYQISFDAKCSKDRNFILSPSGDADNGWEKYGAFDVALGTEMTNYTFVFTMKSPTDPTARLEFNLGNDMGTIWIGNVSVKELVAEGGVDNDMKKSPLSDGNRIYNGTFDQGIERLAFWHVENMDVTIPDYVVSKDGTEDYSRKAQISEVKEDAKLFQKGISVNGGRDYEISLDLSGTSASEVKISLADADGNLYAKQTFTYSGNGEVENNVLAFSVAEDVKDDNAVFTLTVAQGSEIQVDNIRMYEVEE